MGVTRLASSSSMYRWAGWRRQTYNTLCSREARNYLPNTICKMITYVCTTTHRNVKYVIPTSTQSAIPAHFKICGCA